jgi:ATP-dependent Clp protease protease subunit
MSEPKPSIIEGEDPDPLEDITFYVSTYGGSADDMFSIYDVMNFAKKRCDVSTVGLGKVMSAGVLLLAAGTKGKRKIGKNCRVMIHAVSSGNVGTIHNLVNELGEIQNLQEAYIDAIVENSNFTKRTLKKLMDRKVNVYLSAEEAIEYGIADELI